VDFESGMQVLRAIEDFPLATCILDDIVFYEKRELKIAERSHVYFKYF